MTKTYRYPDKDDKSLHKYLMNHAWDDEGLEFELIRQSINSFDKKNRTLLLDIGCGQGRLVPFFHPYFKKTVAIDPDQERLNFAIQLAEVFKFPGHTIQFINKTIQEYCPDHRFDCILCSHLIQHLNTNETLKIIKKIENLLTPAGKLILLTANSPEAENVFYKLKLSSNKHERIDVAEFNALTSNPHFLCERLFAEHSLVELIGKAGLELIFFKKFHGYPKTRGDSFVLAQKKN